MPSKNSYRYATADEVIEAAKSIMESKITKQNLVLNNSALVKNYMMTRIGSKEHEVFSILFLNIKHKLIAVEDMFRGTLDSASVYPREVLKTALKHNAASLILAHNHPSGEVEPSKADIDITNKLKDALALIDIKVLDHIIVSGFKSFSFQDNGLIKNP